ncbi:MAG: ribose-5-phosphate isomerase RpiA [Thermoplasmata archaeon]
MRSNGDLDREKEVAARAATEEVRPGMLLALGTGSTTAFAVQAIARNEAIRTHLTTVASSVATEDLARRLGLAVRPLAPTDHFDLMIDGADEVTPRLELTKGGGGALFREKFLARLSRRVVIIVDHTKVVEFLGMRGPIPIEVVPFARPVIIRELEEEGIPARPRVENGRVVRTDNGNEILDVCPSQPVTDAAGLNERLRACPGVVETGIFLNLADIVIVAKPDGTLSRLEASPGSRRST